jgi:hypothetical protein
MSFSPQNEFPLREVIVRSEEMKNRKGKTSDRKKEWLRPKRDSKMLTRTKFACVQDADDDLGLWRSEHPHNQLRNVRS